MGADAYLTQILNREAVTSQGYMSPADVVMGQLQPHLQAWANFYLLNLSPSGSYAKGTANVSGTDVDLFVSLSEHTPGTLKEIYESLFTRMQELGLSPKRQNVSINVRVGSYDVDLVPARHQGAQAGDHSLYRRRADTWTKTNVAKHIQHVQAAGRQSETRILKLWRNQKGLDFPSFYLELATIAALQGQGGSLSDRVWTALAYLRDTFPNARFVDPANTNNIVSDDLNATERQRIATAAAKAREAKNWQEIVT